MNGTTFWRSRDGTMRQRREASPTRVPRRRPLPTKKGHAALPLATRDYESDTTSSDSRSSLLRHPGVVIFARPRKTAQQPSAGCSLLARHHYGKSCWAHERRRCPRFLSFQEKGAQAAFGSYLQRVEMTDEHIRPTEQGLSGIAASEEHAAELAAEGGDLDSGGGEGRISGTTFRRLRDGTMRQRRFASPTRDIRMRLLLTKKGHAALPLATREYESDKTSNNSRSSLLRHPGVVILARPPPQQTGRSSTAGRGLTTEASI